MNALGLESLRHSVFATALAVYSRGLARYPSNSAMMLGLAMSEYGENDFTDAASLLSRLAQKNAHNQTYLEMLEWSCSMDMSDPGSACDYLVKYTRYHPGDAIAATSAAATMLNRRGDRQDLALVRALLERALAADPNSMDANYLMGTLDQEQSRWQASIPFLRKAVQVDSGSGKAHYRLARAYFRLGRRAEGEREIELNAQCNREQEIKADRTMKNLGPVLAEMR